jgi:hypothetical protein
MASNHERAEGGLGVILALKSLYRMIVKWVVLPVMGVGALLNPDKPDLKLQFMLAVLGLLLIYALILLMERLFRHLAS